MIKVNLSKIESKIDERPGTSSGKLALAFTTDFDQKQKRLANRARGNRGGSSGASRDACNKFNGHEYNMESDATS